MNESYYRITLDIKSIQSQISLPIKQGDTGRGIYISLTDGGKPYVIGQGCFPVFKGEKSDGTTVGNNCYIENNRIVYPITQQTVASPGIVECEVSLYDIDRFLITSPRFTLVVDSRAVGSDEYTSSSEYNVLETYLTYVREAEAQRQANEEERQQALLKKVPYPLKKNDGTTELEVNHGSLNQTLKSYGDGRTYWVDEKPNLSANKFPFELIDLPLTETNYTYIYKDGICQKKGKEEDGVWKETSEEGFSPITKCPKYLGFRIDGNDARLYLYIGTLDGDGKFVLDESYHIDTTGDNQVVNHLRQSHNRFIETDGNKYFYYKVKNVDENENKVTLMGCDEFPAGESDIIATSNVVVKNGGYVRTASQRYYSVVLPSGCFYAVLNKNGMPTFLKDDIEDDELTTKPLFNVSYQKGVKIENEEEIPDVEVSRGASFGYIPEKNIGAALLRIPDNYELSDLCIYTSKIVKSNAKSGRRRKAKEIGEKIIKDFSFKSKKAIFWNDSTHPMTVGRRFYGVPYSSRWVNSHYLGFEVTPETVLNALNDPYSIAYDGGFEEEKKENNVLVGKKRGTSVSGHTEITGDPDNLKDGGGTGYGLVCSAFTSLICGNPYPQSNRGYTFDSNFVLEDAVDMNSGEVLVKDSLSHCVFVDEIYDDGYSLYEAVDPCVTKTTHTCLKDKTTYAASNVRTSTLDKYIYSVINKDISGYDKLTEDNLLNLDNITIANGSVRPWRGNKAVYGSWDKTPKAAGRDFGGSGIGVTIHNKLRYKDGDEDKEEIMARTFTLKTPSTEKTITIPDDALYLNISDDVTENGEYEIISTVKKREKQEDGTYVTNTYSVSEYFRYYNHDTVQLTFDEEGKAVFKNCSDGTVADDVEYIYVSVKGYGGAFGNDGSEGAMVIAKGKCYPDLAIDPSRITDVRAAIVSDPADECWGKYSCATSPEVVSEYTDYFTKDIDLSGIETTANSHIHGENGGVETPPDGEEPFKVTSSIPIAYPGATLTFKSLLHYNAGWAIYDKDGAFIIGGKGRTAENSDPNNGRTIVVTIPDYACYLRFTMGKDESVSKYFVKVKYTDLTKYTEFLIKEKLGTELETAIGVTTEPKEIELPKIDNFYYDRRAEEYADGDGKASYQNAQCTHLIRVTEGQRFLVTGQYGYYCCLVAEFDKNQGFIRGVFTNENGTQIATDYGYTVPKGVSYVGFSTRNGISGHELIIKRVSTTFRDIGKDVDVLSQDVDGLNEDVQELKGSVAELENNQEIEALANEVEKIKAWGIVSKNLYNPANDTFGGRADNGGHISLNLRNSEWIAIEPSTNYVLSNNCIESGIALYVAQKNNDGSISVYDDRCNIGANSGYLITTPETATHIRFSTYTDSANDLMRDYIMLEKGNKKTKYEPYKIILDYKNRLPEAMQNIWEGKKMVVDGDSITHDYERNYWQFVASEILGMYIDTSVKSADDDAENGVYGCGWRGIGGSTIANEEQAKINKGIASTDNPLSRSILLRHQNLPDDADIVLIAGGSNDWAHSVIEMGDYDSTDDTTFYGALNILLPSLKTKYPTIPVVMMTPIKRTETHNAKNSLGYTLEDFVNAMTLKCREYGVYCLDMWGTCPINPQIPTMLQMFFRPNDSTHPNAEGHRVMGKAVAGFIRTLD